MIGEASTGQGPGVRGQGARRPTIRSGSTSSETTTRLQTLVLVGLAFIALLLRLWQIDRESFWLDEAGRAAIAALPFNEIAHGVAVVELSPPLYHYLLAVWIRLAGDGDASVRLLSALLAVPSVALGWSLGRAVAGPAVGLGLAALVAVSPFAVHYGQEAAMYGLLLPLGMATIRAAVGAVGGDASTAAGRAARSRWLLAYVALGTLSLYTHYYAAFLLLTVGVVGIAHSIARRSRHGAIIWLAAHIVIGLAFVPWVPTLLSQAGLAASVGDWSGVGPGEALVNWSAALFADEPAAGWSIPIPLIVAIVGGVIGAWRLRDSGPIVWLMVGLVVIPLVLATVASGFFHSFRERGFIAVAPASWLLVVSAVFADGPPGPTARLRVLDAASRALVVAGLGFVTAVGLWYHYVEMKEDWRSAAAIVAADVRPGDPIFFVHFASQIPFDRYFRGSQPRIGLPESFDWRDGYRARYLVAPDDVARRVPPALVGSNQAWAVFSHDGGRGSEHLLAALDRWGTRAGDRGFVGVRVLRYQIRGSPGRAIA